MNLFNPQSSTVNLTPPVGASAVTVNGVIQTTSAPVADFSQTWNASGTTFTGLKINITNTASAAASKLIDVLVGGVSVLSLVKDGALIIRGGASSRLEFAGEAIYAMNTVGDQYKAMISQYGIRITGDRPIGFTSSTTNVATAPDTMFSRGGAAIIQQGDADAASPVAQALRAQGSRAGTDSNVGGANFTVQAGTGTGTGTLSSLVLQAPIAVGSGTGAQTQTTGLTIKNGAAVFPAYAVASLPVASTVPYGRCFATDANATLTAGIGTTVAAGGANKVPVFSDGTNWIIG